MAAVSRVELGRYLMSAWKELEHDRATLSEEAFEEKYPTPLTPAQQRVERRRKMDDMRAAGGTPWEVWSEGYKGMGPTIPSCLGIVDAPSFDDAVEMLDPKGEWRAYEGPLHGNEAAAWVAYDAYWADKGSHRVGDDPRRPPGEIRSQ